MSVSFVRLFELLAEYYAERDRINRTTYFDKQRAAAVKFATDKTRRIGHREIRRMVQRSTTNDKPDC